MSDIALTDLRTGVRAIVSAVAGIASRVDKLAAMGILPGVELLIHQKTPVVVIECGETVLAVEHELARDIRVAPCEAPAT